MLKVLLITLILTAIAVAGLGIRILLEKNGRFSGGSCQPGSDDLKEKGIICGCGGYCSNDSSVSDRQA